MEAPSDARSSRSASLARHLLGVTGLIAISTPLFAGAVLNVDSLETNSGIALPTPRVSLEFPAELAEWLGENAAFKPQAVRLDGWIDRRVFRETPAAGTASPRVEYGSNGVMFIVDAFNEACSPHINTADLVKQVFSLGNVIQDSGRDFWFVVSPDKSSILQEFLPEAHPLYSCFMAYNTDLWQQLALSDIPGFIDLHAELSDARIERRELLYKKRDTHWDDAGAAVASRAVLEAITPGIWNDDHLEFTGVTEYSGDLNTLAGETEIDTSPSYYLGRLGVEAVLTEGLPGEGMEGTRNYRTVHSSSQEPLIPGRTVIFGDSFSEIAERFFVTFFEDVSIMRLAEFNNQNYLDLIRSADRVIVWSVERSLPYRVAYDWGRVEFADLLEQYLAEEG